MMRDWDCWVLVGFGPDPYCLQRLSRAGHSRGADLSPWAGFDHGNSCVVKYRCGPLADCVSYYLSASIVQRLAARYLYLTQTLQ